MNEDILFVDDEQNVLDAFKRQWHKRFKVSIACSGVEGLQKIQEEGPFAVIVTDMRMPEMDGIQFLKEVQRIAPDSTRLMLTGNADQQTAIDAVNEGHVFRFLSKPCPNDLMQNTLETAIRQYHLVTSERELIEGTLKSSINLFMDMLALNSSVDINLRGNILERARSIARSLGVRDLWQVEMAAMMSNIADATLPAETREKLHQGQDLSEAEQEVVSLLPVEAHDLLVNIPRMHKVARIVLYQFKNFDGSGYPQDGLKGVEMPLESRILRVIHDLSVMQKAGQMKVQDALQQMQARSGEYDPQVLQLVIDEFADENGGPTGESVDVMVEELAAGQRLECNIETLDGRILVKAGTELNDMRVKTVLHYHKINRIREPISVLVR